MLRRSIRLWHLISILEELVKKKLNVSFFFPLSLSLLLQESVGSCIFSNGTRYLGMCLHLDHILAL